MRIRRQIVSCGGQMTTAMAACAKFGLRAKYVGVTGTDENGRRLRATMAGSSGGHDRLGDPRRAEPVRGHHPR